MLHLAVRAVLLGERRASPSEALSETPLMSYTLTRCLGQRRAQSGADAHAREPTRFRRGRHVHSVRALRSPPIAPNASTLLVIVAAGRAGLPRSTLAPCIAGGRLVATAAASFASQLVGRICV